MYEVHQPKSDVLRGSFRKTGRSSVAFNAIFNCKGGYMKDRRASRGGAQNEERDYLDEYLNQDQE